MLINSFLYIFFLSIFYSPYAMNILKSYWIWLQNIKRISKKFTMPIYNIKQIKSERRMKSISQNGLFADDNHWSKSFFIICSCSLTNNKFRRKIRWKFTKERCIYLFQLISAFSFKILIKVKLHYYFTDNEILMCASET